MSVNVKVIRGRRGGGHGRGIARGRRHVVIELPDDRYHIDVEGLSPKKVADVVSAAMKRHAAKNARINDLRALHGTILRARGGVEWFLNGVTLRNDRGTGPIEVYAVATSGSDKVRVSFSVASVAHVPKDQEIIDRVMLAIAYRDGGDDEAFADSVRAHLDRV